jgi:hypothetical protein
MWKKKRNRAANGLCRERVQMCHTSFLYKLVSKYIRILTRLRETTMHLKVKEYAESKHVPLNVKSNHCSHGRFPLLNVLCAGTYLFIYGVLTVWTMWL